MARGLGRWYCAQRLKESKPHTITTYPALCGGGGLLLWAPCTTAMPSAFPCLVAGVSTWQCWLEGGLMQSNL
ncbi:hypothetical protein CLOM_g6890 [Closterium sp. NIES-68]|nr:hypothetical protein CLOM_g6890 [Closterium sp. NIES-68]